MKNNLITRMGILISLLLLGFMGQAQTTSLLIGTVRNEVGTITNLENAKHLLIANLPENSAVSDLKLEYSADEAKYYLTAKVSGNGITSVGIQLGQTGSSVSALAGTGVTLSCNGFNCSNCRIAFAKGGPFCKCFTSPLPSDYRCDMTSTVTIGF